MKSTGNFQSFLCVTRLALTHYFASALAFAVFCFLSTAARASDVLTVSLLNPTTRIEVIGQFDATANYLVSFASGLNGPLQFAYDHNGNLFVTVTGDNTIHEFGPRGADLGTFANTGLSLPEGLAIDSNDNVYASNWLNGTIREFSPTGVDLGTFASGLTNPQCMTFDSQGNLYVFTESNTIHEFGPTGTDLGVFASTGLNNPFGLAFDSHGNLFVANQGEVGPSANSIHEFSSTGVDLGTFASAGLLGPTDLAFDSNGNMFVASAGNSRIHEYGPTGVDLGPFVDTYGLNGTLPIFLAFAPAVPEPATAILALLGVVAVFACYWRRMSIDRGRANRTRQFLVQRCWRFFVVSSLAVAVFCCPSTAARASDVLSVSLYNPSTQIEVLGQFDATANYLGSFASGLNDPQQFAYDQSGNLYITVSNDNTIHKFGPRGADLGTFASTGLSSPEGLAIDSNENVYASNWSNGTIREFSPTGADLGTFASGLDHPQNMTFDSQGNLYVSTESNTIHEFGPSGTDMGVFASTGLNDPGGLAFDSHGNLFVANSGEFGTSANSVHEFSSTGVDLGTFASAGLLGPTDLAFDSNGNMFVASAGNGRIHEFSPTGVDLGPFVYTYGLNGTVPGRVAFGPAVPEPATAILALLGVVAFLARPWRRRLAAG